MKKNSPYKRCKVCKELISKVHVDCPNCENRNALSIPKRDPIEGKRGRPTLDIQEGNYE